MTFTIESDASREEWDAFLEAIEAEALGTEDPVSPPASGAEAPRITTVGAGDDLIELLSEVWGFHVGAVPRP